MCVCVRVCVRANACPCQVLSDELVRVDAYMESVVRKIERHFADSEEQITDRKVDEGEAKMSLTIDRREEPASWRRELTGADADAGLRGCRFRGRVPCELSVGPRPL